MRNRGFTLIELLVSVAIFAILGVLAYGGYNTSLRQAAIARDHMGRLRELQTAVRMLTQDFEQLASRPVRETIGDGQLPAIQSDPQNQFIVTLTRNGWSNPAGLPRSTLQRVMYVLEDGNLRRDHWTVLDATLSSQIVRRQLLARVESVQIRYLGGAQRAQWQTQWPPQGAQSQPAAQDDPLDNPALRTRPIAVEISLELEDLGKITRLVEVGG